MRYLLGLVLASLLYVLPVNAQTFKNGTELLKDCTAAVKQMDNPSTTPKLTETPEVWRCTDFIDGFLQGYAEGLLGQPVNGDFCVNEVPGGQLLRAVLKYLNDHPADLYNSAGSLMWSALYHSFPCKN